MGRREFLWRLSVLALGVPTAAVAHAGCANDGPPMTDGPMGGERSGDGMPDWMMGGDGMDAQMMRDMRVIRELLVNHADIERTVRDVRGGIRSVTTSADEQVAQRIQTHVWQMKQRIEKGDVIRQMDPVFREIFERSDDIQMEIDNLDHGVQVLETSNDPQVALLIRQHARRAVSEFVADGMSRARRPTPMPSGYTS